MSAHVLLNLLNEWRKRDKMRGLPSLISSIIYVGARVLDYIYHNIKILSLSILIHGVMSLPDTTPYNK